MVIKEVAIGYRERPAGSYSKLSPLKDGCRIVLLITTLLLEPRQPARTGGGETNVRAD